MFTLRRLVSTRSDLARRALSAASARLESSTAADQAPPHPADSSEHNIYVLADDDEAAQAFDDFYNAYDEVHAKTRSFLLD